MYSATTICLRKKKTDPKILYCPDVYTVSLMNIFPLFLVEIVIASLAVSEIDIRSKIVNVNFL